MTESSRSLHKKHQDRVSKLPDEILISIISRLTLREATATSVLSTCWRHLHTYITHLNFPPRSYSSDPSIEYEKRLNHINMVNHVLEFHRGSRIKEFGVISDQFIGCDKLLEFALTRKAGIIHMNISGGQFLTLSRTTISKYDLECLKELSLCGIDMTDQDFDLLVSNYLSIESLSIKFPGINLKNVSIVGHSKLKHFNLSNDSKVGSIKIRDVVNLVSLKCHELSTSTSVVQLSNIPKLIKLDYKEEVLCLPHAEFCAKMPSCVRDQLQLLHLSTCRLATHYKLHTSLYMSVELVNIKHLELVIDDMDDEHEPTSYYILLRSLCCLIDKCSGSLQKLIIKFSYKRVCHMEFEEINMEMKKLSLKYLKEIEIIGYFGSPPESKLASHLFNNARALEKLTVVPCDLNDTVREVALARAKRLFQPIRSINVIILGKNPC